MTDSTTPATPTAPAAPTTPAKPTRGSKRERLAAAAAQVFHQQGVERTTLSDIATAADVPLGNVYYYFKTKDQLVEAAIGSHLGALHAATGHLAELPTPADRLKALIGGWIEQRETAARFGCPFGTLATELDKRQDGLDQTAAGVMRALIEWVEGQFAQMGRSDAHDLATEFVAAYQGMAVLTNVLRDPEVMTVQGRRLADWVDTLA